MKCSSLIFSWIAVDSEENSTLVLWGSCWVFFQDLSSSSLDSLWTTLSFKIKSLRFLSHTLFKTTTVIKTYWKVLLTHCLSGCCILSEVLWKSAVVHVSSSAWILCRFPQISKILIKDTSQLHVSQHCVNI